MSIEFAADTNKPKTSPFLELIATTQFRDDFLQRVGKYIIKIVYDNQDPTNNATIRTVPSGILQTVPPNSLGVIEDEIHSFVEINPNAITGLGILTLTLAEPAELRRLGLLN